MCEKKFKIRPKEYNGIAKLLIKLIIFLMKDKYWAVNL